MAWTFEQSTGIMYDPSGAELARGYSGAPGFIDDPADQSMPDEGPIPQGKYSIGPEFDGAETGPDSLPLTPDPANQEFGRGGFLIHGDSIAHPGCGSKGCIVLPPTARALITGSTDKELQVVDKRT